MPLNRVDYVHRGDIGRRRLRNRRYILFTALVASVVLLARVRQEEASASTPLSFTSPGERRLRAELDSATGELNIARAELERAQRIIDYSTRYRVGADLAAAIFDIALAEGIEPELGFRVVKVESEFKENATSPVGAIGLMQVMLPTARHFDRSITAARLYQRETNLRIGFRYLRTLINEYKDVKIALLVYNRGPVAVNALRSMGLDPGNGYDRMVMKGYEGRATVD